MTNGFTNQGMIEITAATAGDVPLLYVNAGTLVNLAGATIRLQVGSFAQQYTNLYAPTIDNEGGTISGTGTLKGTVINAGQVNPGGSELPGILTVTGDYTQTAAGVLNLEIGGPSVGNQYDRLAISGAATLDGTCNVSLINHFQPEPGRDAFRVLTCAT